MNKKWTKEEDEILKLYYPNIGWRVYLMLEGRSKAACQIRASTLGVHYKHAHKEWDDYEGSIMRSFYPIIGIRVCEMLPGRSDDAIYRYASDNGISVISDTRNRRK